MEEETGSETLSLVQGDSEGEPGLRPLLSKTTAKLPRDTRAK